MSILFIAFGATLLGFLLVMLIGRGQPTSPAARESAPQEGVIALAWVRGYGVEGFQKMLLTLFAEMGFSTERTESGRTTVDFHAVDPAPIRGGRIYVRGIFANLDVPVDAEDVRTLLDTARAESVGKAVMVTLGRFSEEARETARDHPIDLLDGDQLATLVKKHLPQAYATRTL